MQITGRMLADFFEQEVPTGLVNDSNTSYTVSSTPVKVKALILMINGVVQRQPTDYSISGTTITMVTAPASGEKLYCFYLKR